MADTRTHADAQPHDREDRPEGGPVAADAFRTLGTVAWRIVGIVIVIAAMGWLVAELKLLFASAIIGMLLASILAPVVNRLEGWGLDRRWGALAATFGGVALVGGLLALIGFTVADQVGALGTAMSDAVNRLADSIPGIEEGSGSALEQLREQATSMLSGGEGGSGSSFAVDGLTSVVEALTGLVLAIVLSFFLLRDGERIWSWVTGTLRPGLREDVDAAGRSAHTTLSSYVRSLALVGLIESVVTGVGLLVIGVPLALSLAVLTFFAAFIPTLGALTVGALAVAVAFASGGLGSAVVVLTLYVAVQQLESNILSPIVMGHTLPLHPAVVLMALTAGAILGGVLGAFLGIPMAAAVVAAMHALRCRRERLGPFTGLAGVTAQQDGDS